MFSKGWIPEVKARVNSNVQVNLSPLHFVIEEQHLTSVLVHCFLIISYR